MLCRFFSLLFCVVSFAWTHQVAGLPYTPTNCEAATCGTFHVYADYLYWKPVQDQMAYAMKAPIELAPSGDLPTSGLIKAKVVQPSFKYRSGFRVGVGYDFPCTFWDTQVSWTSLHDKVKSRVSGTNRVLPLSGFLLVTDSDSLANSGVSHWHFEFDVIDLTLGRNFMPVCDVFFRPYVGAKIANIKQKQNSAFFGLTNRAGEPVFLSTSKRNAFRGVGPSLGVDAALKFCSNWSLNGGISGALLYGKFNTHNNSELLTDGDLLAIHVKDRHKFRLRPNMNTYFGIGWETCFCDSYQFKVGVAYELQYWWNQWQVAPGDNLAGVFNAEASGQGDLMLHGLTASIGLAF